MKLDTKLKPSSSLVDLTPLVDVVFLMLIFFIITSDILPLKSLNIQTPILAEASAPLTTQLIVVMDKDHVIYLGSKKTIIDLASIENKLKEEIKRVKSPDPTLVLSVDTRVDYGVFFQLFSAAQKCCSKIRLVYREDDHAAL